LAKAKACFRFATVIRLADDLRSHPEIDRKIANHLKDLADGILKDVGRDRSKVLAA